MKILHITHHDGCKESIDFICKELGYEITTQKADWNYNMSKQLALDLWIKYKEYYNTFDLIIISDTASISRIFLENGYDKKLIIWVCNRFDYADECTNFCKFPDPEFYDLFKNATSNKNIFIRSYTKFEHEYSEKYRNIVWDNEIIKPCNVVKRSNENNFFKDGSLKKDTFLITSYHNDNIFIDLKKICDDLKIKTYRGRYEGPSDLIGIKGIIHIPYAWSNLALFENWSIGNIYFIPSKNFLIKLSEGGGTGDFFWSPPFDKSFIDSSEWYLKEHSHLFVYFDSFEHLSELTSNKSYIDNIRNNVLNFSKSHVEKTLQQWKKLINL